MTTISLNQAVRQKPHNAAISIVFLLTPKKSIGYLEEEFTLRQCLEKMRYHGYTAMPVISRKGEYIGTVSEGDFLWYIMDHGEKHVEKVRLKEILRGGWNPAITINESIGDVLERMLDQNFLPVVDDRNAFMGIITRKSVLQYYKDRIQT